MGPQEFALVAIVGFLIFGAKKLPEMARSVGSSIVEFKKALKGEHETPAEKPQEGVQVEQAQAQVGAPQGQLALPEKSTPREVGR